MTVKERLAQPASDLLGAEIACKLGGKRIVGVIDAVNVRGFAAVRWMEKDAPVVRWVDIEALDFRREALGE